MAAGSSSAPIDLESTDEDEPEMQQKYEATEDSGLHDNGGTAHSSTGYS